MTLESCNYTPRTGTSAADCGTLVVPENRHDPHSRLIALPVTRIRAHSAHPGVPIFRLQGGPGITNMEFPDASRFTDNHDVVLVGYRGVDGSTRLDCPEVSSSREHSRDLLSEQSFRADAAAYRSCADRLRSEVSIWPATPSPNASTTSSSPAAPSAITRSTWSAKARAPAPR